MRNVKISMKDFIDGCTKRTVSALCFFFTLVFLCMRIFIY